VKIIDTKFAATIMPAITVGFSSEERRLIMRYNAAVARATTSAMNTPPMRTSGDESMKKFPAALR
jgi:hypothetical protein